MVKTEPSASSILTVDSSRVLIIWPISTAIPVSTGIRRALSSRTVTSPVTDRITPATAPAKAGNGANASTATTTNSLVSLIIPPFP